MADLSNILSMTLLGVGERPGTWGPVLNENFETLDALFSATTGHNHDGSSGQGGQIPHSSLLNAGSNSHIQIDSHIADTALHQDTRISQVQNFAETITVTNVSTLRFDNATVEEVAPGIALVTPTGGGGGGDARELSAPVVYYDTFSGEPGVLLANQGYTVDRAQAADPEFKTTTSLGQPFVGAQFDVGATDNRTGFCTNIIKDYNPHSVVQRVGVTVSDIEVDTDVDNVYGIWLHLLASDRRGASSFSSPVEAGCSLAIRTTNVGGAIRLALSIVVRRPNTQGTEIFNGPFVAPGNWTNPNGGGEWDNLPVNYLLGSHEFSLSIPASRNGYTLNYYYRNGLIFRRTFTSSDGAFYDALDELAGELQAATGPAVPDFGKIGFSAIYDLESGVALSMRISSVMASSIDEQTTTSVVSLPTTTAPPQTFVCDNDPPFTGIALGDFYDPDGSGPIPGNAYTVQSIFDPSGNKSDGFTIVGQGNSIDIYCDPPVAFPGAPQCVTPNTETPGIGIPFTNVPPAMLASVEFTAGSADIPVDWKSGNPSSTTYSIGDTLPSSFISSLGLSAGTSALNTDELLLSVQGGNRLPWGAQINVNVTPSYTTDLAYGVEVPDALVVCPGTPTIQQKIPFHYDPPTGSWTPSTPSTPACEGGLVGFWISGVNIPLGEAFWDSGVDIANGFGFADTENGAGVPTLEVLSSSTHPFSVYYTRLYNGRLDASAAEPITGAPPTSVTPSTQTIATNFATVPGPGELFVVLGRLDARAWNGGNPESVQLELRDNFSTNPSSIDPVTLLSSSRIKPMPITGFGGNPTVGVPPVDDTTAGGSPTITVGIGFPDPDVVVIPGTGFSGPPASLEEGDAGVSVAGDEERQIWTITGLTLSGTPGTDITVTVRNPAALEAAALNSALGSPDDHEQEIILGTVGSTPSLTPVVNYTAGTIREDKTETITFEVDVTTVEPNTAVLVPPAFDEFIAVIQPVDKNPGGTPVGDILEWFVDVACVDRPGGGTLPSTVSLDFYNPESDITTTVSGIPAVERPAPDIVKVDLDSQGSNITSWKITEQTQRDIYVTIQNAPFNEIAEFRILPTTSTGSITVQSFEHVSGDVFLAKTAISGMSLGDTLSFYVSLATAGTALEDTLPDAITITPGITINDPSAISQPVEGRYVTFNFTGQFSAAGTREIDFVNGSGTTIVRPGAPVNLTTSSGSVLGGSFRLADNTEGEDIVVKVTLVDEAFIESFDTGLVVEAPPIPRITDTVFSTTEAGATGVTITITGNSLTPPDPPAGESALSFIYTFTDTFAGTVLTNVSVSGTPADNEVIFTADIDAGAAGETVGLDIDYLGGNTVSFTGLETIGSQPSGNEPQVTNLYASDGGTPRIIFLPETVGNGSGTMVIEGTDLGAANVGPSADLPTGVRLQVVGYDNEATGQTQTESPSGDGLHPDFALGKGVDCTILSQTSTEIEVSVPIDIKLVNTRLLLELGKPTGHAQGAGLWLSSDIDQITPADPSHAGISLQGPPTTRLHVNGAPGQGLTRLDAAVAARAETGAGSEGNAFNVTIRFDRAVTTPPTFVAVPDPQYGFEFTIVGVENDLSSDFQWVLRLEVPNPSDISEYPDGTFSITNPVAVGITLSNGIPVLASVLGVDSWTYDPIVPDV